MDDSDELNGSELGTQDYWDKCYQLEIKNFLTHGDHGEIWFGEDSILRVLDWIDQKKCLDSNSKIIDIGCGNGLFLIELSRMNFKNLYGVDYSKPAIDLAREISKKHDISVTLKICDILKESENLGSFDLVHDKGTYDAICLNPDNPKEKRNQYKKSIELLMKENSYFIITSCNWTKDELVEHFEGIFKLLEEVPTPQFKFGGKTGSVVTTLVFVKNV